MVITPIFMGVGLLVKGDHLIGGEISYECVGDNTYVITLEIYRDCNSAGADFDEFAVIGLFNENNEFLSTSFAPYPEVEQLPIETGNPCLSAPPDICVEQGITTVEITVPDASQGYYVVYQRCCRNATIQNLIEPSTQGNTLQAYIPPGDVAECNSSPQFDNYPPLVLCTNDELEFDHSATDPDGDSLSYELCTPFTGGSQAVPAPNPPTAPPYDEVVWDGGFSATNPLGANPPMSLDPVTGLLEVTPTQQGQYVVGVCVNEWRDGQLISTNRRDFQFNVTVCIQDVEASIVEQEPEEVCGGLTANFEANTESVSFYHWNFGDPSTDDDTSNVAFPSYTYPDTGVYTITLIGNPGFECADTSVVEYVIYEEVEPFFGTPNFECESGEQFYNFNAGGQYIEEMSTFEWDFGAGANPPTSTLEDPQEVFFPGPGTYPVELTITQGECQESIQSEVVVPDPIDVEINPQTQFCNGLNVGFTQENNGAVFYQWDFGVSGTDDDTSDQPNANFTFPEPGEYTVTLEAWTDQNCPDVDTEVFEVFPLLDADFERPPVECINENTVDFEAGGSFTEQADFLWQFQNGSPSTSTEQNPQGVSFEAIGSYEVSLTISENDCQSQHSDSVRIEPNPVAMFDVYESEGCVPFRAGFINNSITNASSHSYSWNFGDGSEAGGRTVGHTYEEPGTYSVTLTLNNFSGCTGSSEVTIEDLIRVYPRPTPGFRVSPVPVSIFEPVADITFTGSGATSCSYYFTGDSRKDQFDLFDHRFQVLEPQTIRQVVENDFGCRSSKELFIPFSDHVVYTPNAFTPDGDGINDLFKPKSQGVVQFEMWIFNRWGEMIFHTTDGSGWDGTVKGGSTFAPNGIYQYKIKVEDLRGWNHEYNGSVQLIR